MGENSPSEILLSGRLDGRQRTRLQKLLNMMYTPRELADDIGFSVRQVYRVYIPLGLPHKRDKNNHIWINGVVFREWVHEAYRKRKLKADEAFCLTCKTQVKIVNPERKEKGLIVYDLCDCPNCGRKLTRIIKKRKR